MEEARRWQWGDNTGHEGWYSILYCWDPREGEYFTGVARWDGSKWESGLPIVAHAGPIEGYDEHPDRRRWQHRVMRFLLSYK